VNFSPELLTPSRQFGDSWLAWTKFPSIAESRTERACFAATFEDCERQTPLSQPRH
jgi:hypothetical protein